VEGQYADLFAAFLHGAIAVEGQLRAKVILVFLLAKRVVHPLMSIRSKSLLTMVVMAIAVSVSCGKKEADATPTAENHPAAAPAPPPLAAGISQDLKKNPTAPFYNFDSLGSVNYPAVQKDIRVSGDTDMAVSGWALDESKKSTAGGVDVVLDQVPHNAHYGLERSDVASHFKRPDYAGSGFQLVVARGQLTKGPHTVSVRVISSDKKSYNEGPAVQFTVN
jgi:hypothetical protein